MKLKSTRITLTPFTLDLIDAALKRDCGAMASMGFTATEEWPESDLVEALPFFRDLIVQHGVNGFNSWLITLNATGEIAGSLGFIGNPDSEGAVEIGFGIVPGKRRQGYCREAVNLLAAWALRQHGVRRITGKCEEGNAASVNALRSAGFVQTGHEGALIVWEYRKDA